MISHINILNSFVCGSDNHRWEWFFAEKFHVKKKKKHGWECYGLLVNSLDFVDSAQPGSVIYLKVTWEGDLDQKQHDS